MRCIKEKVGLDKGKDTGGFEKAGVEDGHEKQRAWNTTRTRSGDEFGSEELRCKR